MPLRPTNEVLGYIAPRVKGGEVTFGLRVEGGIAALHTSPALALALARDLAIACGLVFTEVRAVRRANPPAPPKRPEQCGRGWGRGRGIDPAKRSAYVAAYSEWKLGAVRSQTEAARKHGLKYAAWVTWCCKHRDELDLICAEARSPLLKPGGKLL